MSRTREGAGCVEGPGAVRRVEQEGKSGARSRMHARTHKCTPMRAHPRTAPSLARTEGWSRPMVGRKVVTFWSDGVVARESSLEFDSSVCNKNETCKCEKQVGKCELPEH